MNASGQESKSAVKKATVWGTAVACGVGNGILVKGHSLKRSEEVEVPGDDLGITLPTEVESGAVKCEGDIPGYLRYDSLDLLVALAMGATGGAPVQQGLTAAYAQTFSLEESVAGLFATYLFNNGVNIEEYMIKVAGFTIKGVYGNACEIVFNVISKDKVTGSVVNTLVTFDNVTFPELANRVLFSQGVFMMNAQSGDALDAGDTIYPSAFELSFKRAMEGAAAAGEANTIYEPLNSGPAEVRLKLDFPRYSDKLHFTDWAAKTAKKADITFTGAVIEGAYSRVFKIELPYLRYAEVDLPVEKGPMKHSVSFIAKGVDTAPTGMTVTNPFKISVINKMSTDVLA